MDQDYLKLYDAKKIIEKMFKNRFGDVEYEEAKVFI